MEENQVHIPDGWQLKQVQEFALKMRSGGTPKSDNPKFYNGEIPFVAIDDLTSANKYLVKTQKHITKQGLNNSAAWLVPVNTIMYSIYATLGVPRINLIEAATNQAILNIIPDERKITLEFLFYLLLEKRSSILAHSAHTTQSNLNAKIVKELEFVFPKNPKEQTQIATILSKVDEAITQTEKLISKYTRIKTGLMQDLLTKGIDENGNIRSEETHEFKDSPLGRIPKEWDDTNLSFFIDKLESGVSVNSDDSPIGGNQLGVLKTSALSNHKFNHKQNKTVKSFDISRLKCPVRKGAILISRMNTPDLVGENALVKDNYENLYLPDRIWQTIFKNTEELNIEWLAIILKSEVYRKKIAFLGTGTSNSMKNISKKSFLEISIPKIPVAEQLKISNKILALESFENSNINQLSKLQSLKTGLMQDLLSGKVRVNHLIKETASV